MATFALLLWPFLALIVFARSALVPAILTATFVPYLLLPEAHRIFLPFAPDLDKTATVSIGLVTGLVFFGCRAKKKVDLPVMKTANRFFGFTLLSLMVTILVGTVLTVMNNREMLFFGPTVLPAMQAWDVISSISGLTLLLVPFFIARRYLATPDAHRALLRILVLSALLYSLLMLVEFRFSPQLHNWIYGYHQHSFLQHIRDGYRPMVFLQHGLWVGFFLFMALLGAAALWKIERNSKWMWFGGWIFAILMVSKNLGAFAIGLICLSLLLGLWLKMQIRIIVLIALVTLTYPALRQADLIPLGQIMASAELVSKDRAGSLEFRLNNEDLLLERAFQKPLVGWGGWARDRIYDDRGVDVSISEGLWILTLGAWGWIGYVGLFGTLTLPLISLSITSRRKDIPVETIALALICSGNLIYLIPNATLTPIGLLCFGALAGFAQYDKVNETVQNRGIEDDSSLAGQRYTRFSPAAKQRDSR